jgi:hypothetical protein
MTDIKDNTAPIKTGPRRIVPPVDFVPRGVSPIKGAPVPKLLNHGGPVIGAVEVIPIYWGAAWASGTNATLATQLDAFFDFIVTSSYMDLLREYSTPATTIQHGKRLSSVHVSGSEPGTVTPSGRQVTDAQIQTALQGWIAAGTAPATTANTLYFVFLPPNVVSLAFGSQSCTGYCGYHDHVGGVYYAVIPFANCSGCVFPGNFIDTLTEVCSHEFAEAVTDPQLNAWFDPVTGPGDEIGDICNRQTTRLGGFLVQTEWSNAQSACVIAPPAGAEPIVEQHNLFRSADGHVHALWFNFQNGWHQEDRSAIVAGTPAAVAGPFGYAFVNKPTGLLEQHNLFRSADGHVHALWFNFATGWHQEDRSAIVPGTPAAVGNPFGYAFVNNPTGLAEQHNLFRAADGHIHALWFNFATGWHHEDRSTIVAGTPAAVGDPFGYAFVNNPTGVVEQHNLFRSADGHIHAMWFNFATGWHHEDRTAIVAGTPAAVGDPFGYAFINSASGLVEQHNLFRSADGHIHALWFNFATGWHHEDRTAIVAGTPAAVGNPCAYALVNNATGVVEQHNLFRSADGHIHALWFNFATGWHHEDRTALVAGTPAAVGDPVGYAFVNSATGLVEQHNLFRSADGHIHALWFNFTTGWHHEDRTAIVAGTPASVSNPSAYAFIDSATGL